MEKSKLISRRNFIEKAAITGGLAALGSETVFGKTIRTQEILPRELWIATVSQEGLSADTPADMLQTILSIVKRSIAYRPDVVCLPEYYMITRIKQRISFEERVDISEALLKDLSVFARTNGCYMICPAFTRENGKTYNAAVVIDRQGNRIGEYRKMHLPLDELEAGFTPGPLQPPVFKTDFGVIGIQICYDGNWHDGWEALQKQGAEVVFWPSAYSGGRTINARAWENNYVVVTSTREISKICDITGDVVAQTGTWDRNLICAPVNLEKAFIGSWPHNRHFDAIRTKYGRKIKITNYHDENWTVLESISPDVRVNDILKEFNIKTSKQEMDGTDKISNKLRI